MRTGTAKTSKKRLLDLMLGTPFRDPVTNKVTVEKKQKASKLTPLDLIDPEAISDRAERKRRKKKQQRL